METKTMSTEIRELAPSKAVCITHIGPFTELGQAFRKLSVWVEENRVEGGPFLALFYSNPETTPAEELRSDAGMFVDDGFALTDPDLHLVEVAGGSYAATTYIGSYDGLPAAWGAFMADGVPEGYAYRQAPPFEVYVYMTPEAGGAESKTDLHVAIEKL
jgi:AraC family transcriptional regulator